MFSCLQILYIVITHMRRQFKLLNIPSRCKYQTIFYYYSIKIFKFSSDLENTTIICMSLLKDIFQLWDLVFFANEILNIPKEVTLKLYTAYLQQKMVLTSKTLYYKKDYINFKHGWLICDQIFRIKSCFTNLCSS